MVMVKNLDIAKGFYSSGLADISWRRRILGKNSQSGVISVTSYGG